MYLYVYIYVYTYIYIFICICIFRNESIALSLQYGEEKKIKDKLRRKTEKDERLRIKTAINDSREHFALVCTDIDLLIAKSF
jgi:hypothetical protein